MKSLSNFPVFHDCTRIRRLQSRILLERITLGVDQRKVVSNDVFDPPVCIGGLHVDDVIIQGSASTIEVVDDGGVIGVHSANMAS